MENYANLPSRVKAALIDGVLIILVMYATSEILSQYEDVPSWIRVVAFLFIFVLYEPIFVSAFGQTLGHSNVGLHVKRESDTTKNINFPLALLRYLVKLFLGWISLLTVTGNTKKKAIHDFVANSIVIEETK